MYKYGLVGMSWVGSKNLYSVKAHGSNVVKILSLKEFKPLLENQEVSNAVLKGNKVVEVPDAFECCDNLIYKLCNNIRVQVKITKLVDRKTRKYIKFFNHNGLDITKDIGLLLNRYYSLTQNNELSVQGVGQDLIKKVIDMVNKEAEKCGYALLIHPDYKELK